MRELLKQVTNELARSHVDECMVEGCDADKAEVAELLALDPIDHDNTYVALCDDHMPWAEERNELAREVHDKLRQARAEIGHEYEEEIERLKQPEFDVAMDSVALDVESVKEEVGQL